MTEHLSNILQQKFGSRKTFTSNELEAVLRDYYAKPYKEETYRWRIHDLKSRGFIQNVGRGIYSFPNVNKEYIPTITREANKIYEEIHTALPYTNIALTDTAWFNEFMVHQVFRTFIIIDVEKGSTLSVFNNLPRGFRQSYLNPKKEIFENYISNGDEPVIINSMISEAPLKEVNKIKTSSLEKLLVDCAADQLLYAAQQEEIEDIYKNILEKYPINTARMKRYARRRNKEDRVTELLYKAEPK